MTRRVRAAGCAVVLAAAVLAGCGKKNAEANAANTGPAKIDTANNTPMDGVSDAQLKAQAQALTPEQAAAQGMVDTTTHIEDLGSQDSTPAGAANNDTATKAHGATGRATAAPGRPAAPATKP